MAQRTKKLTTAQEASLRKLAEGNPLRYHDFAKAGANGATISGLVKLGLAEEVTAGNGNDRKWSITEAGKTAAEVGRYPVNKV